MQYFIVLIACSSIGNSREVSKINQQVDTKIIVQI